MSGERFIDLQTSLNDTLLKLLVYMGTTSFFMGRCRKIFPKTIQDQFFHKNIQNRLNSIVLFMQIKRQDRVGDEHKKQALKHLPARSPIKSNGCSLSLIFCCVF